MGPGVLILRWGRAVWSAPPFSMVLPRGVQYVFVRATGAILSPVCRAGNPASVAGPGLAGGVGVDCRPQYQPGSGTNWVPVPRGVQYQLGPGGDQVLVPARSGADRVAVPTGRQYQAGPGTNRAAVPTGSQYQLVLRVVWITSRQGNKL
jgi:hypothetical protein